MPLSSILPPPLKISKVKYTLHSLKQLLMTLKFFVEICSSCLRLCCLQSCKNSNGKKSYYPTLMMSLLIFLWGVLQDLSYVLFMYVTDVVITMMV